MQASAENSPCITSTHQQDFELRPQQALTTHSPYSLTIHCPLTIHSHYSPPPFAFRRRLMSTAWVAPVQSSRSLTVHSLSPCSLFPHYSLTCAFIQRFAVPTIQNSVMLLHAHTPRHTHYSPLTIGWLLETGCCSLTIDCSSLFCAHYWPLSLLFLTVGG